MAPSVEQHFARFRSAGDPAALAAVFDHVADELFAVALHLSRDRAGAEDLLQATFLVAIKKRSRWDPTRALRPWLFGILDKEARRWRRWRQRAESSPARSRDDVPAAWHELLRAETRSVVADAIAALPEPYRTVVDLRLVHELSPEAIAQRLARSPGSVRTQLWRGLERLRASLPPGLALGGAVVLARPALAHVRTQVLAAANTVTVSTSLVAGLLAAATTKLAVMSCLVLAGVLVAATWLSPSGDGALRVEAPAATARAGDTASVPRADDAASREPVARVEARIAEDPVADAADQQELHELRGLDARALYDAMRSAFDRGDDRAAGLARTLLAEFLLVGPEKRDRVAAILAAWLDHGAPAEVVVLAALDALPADTREYDDYRGRTAALTLSLAFFPRRGIPDAPPAVEARALAALIARVEAETNERHRGAALAMALQTSGSMSHDTVTALCRLAASPVYAVRGSAIMAMAYAMPPKALLAAIDVAPRILLTEGESLDEVNRLFSLRVAAERHPEERAVYIAWVASRLVRPRDLQAGVVQGARGELVQPEAMFFCDLIGKLTARDVVDLRRELEAVAAGDDEVAQRARQALAKHGAR